MSYQRRIEQGLKKLGITLEEFEDSKMCNHYECKAYERCSIKEMIPNKDKCPALEAQLEVQCPCNRKTSEAQAASSNLVKGLHKKHDFRSMSIKDKKWNCSK